MSDKLEKIARKISKHQKALEKLWEQAADELDDMAGGDRLSQDAMGSAMCRQCLHDQRGIHARSDILACHVLGWDVPIAASR